jgi:hypothetical protein
MIKFREKDLQKNWKFNMKETYSTKVFMQNKFKNVPTIKKISQVYTCKCVHRKFEVGKAMQYCKHPATACLPAVSTALISSTA